MALTRRLCAERCRVFKRAEVSKDRMDSLPPSPDVVDMNLKITRIECHPECLVVVFQGQCEPGCELDYYILQNEIQRVFKVKDTVCVGGSCLVEDMEGTWHRGRVLEKRQSVYEAFLIDTGQVLVVEETHLASACAELFQLPPKVVLGVFASLLPLGEKWSPKAINYFSSLVGLQIMGHVKAVLPYQLFILEVPKILSDVLELRLGKRIDIDSFCFIVEMLRVFPQEMLCKRVPQLLQQKYPVKELLTFSNLEKPTDFWPVPDDIFPHLPVGSKGNVKITVVLSPNKFYCQLQKWQKELEDLTGAMHLYYEATSAENNKSVDNLGLLCAAKRQNGQWHRGVIKQLLSDRVEVWFMDFGNIEAVPSSCVQKLKVEFMALPMVSFPGALSCFDSGDETLIKVQLKELTQALIGQSSVCVRVDLFSDTKHLYYVTLQSQKLGINDKHPENLNEAAALCVSLAETEIKSVAVNYKPCHERHDSVKNDAANEHTKPCSPELDMSSSTHCKRVEMQMNSCCAAFVVYVRNPSDFWIQPCEYQNEFQALMKNIADTYDQCGADEMALRSPEPGLLCCARYSKDMHYYRALVIEVLPVSITVYFLDFGNTDTVPCCDVKALLPEFSGLPALAVCCALACTFPPDDVWTKKETDFFKEIVFNKPVLLHVIGKQNNKYDVNVMYGNGLQKGNVATCMVQAGHAEYWEKTPDSVLNSSKTSQGLNTHTLKKEKAGSLNWSEDMCRLFEDFISASGGPLTCTIYAVVLAKPSCLCNIVDIQTPSISAEEFLRERGLPQSECMDLRNFASLGSLYSFCYSPFNLKIGNEEEVYITHIHSLSEFYCQLNRNSETIEALMKEISAISKTSDFAKYDTSNTRLCIAKYFEDGLFYRALTFPVESTSYLCADFVDFGNKSMVERDQLMPIPDSATDLIFTPMQAIKCCLSDLTETEIPASVTRWFEESFSSKLLKAVIVSRESDGQIVVELYDGELKVSQKVKEKIVEELALKNYTEQFVGSYKGVTCHMESDKEMNKVTVKNSPRRPALNPKEITVNALSESHNGRRNYTGHREKSKKNIPKLISLPQRGFQVDSEVAGYISHVNSPSSFFVQLAEDKNLIIQLAKDLKESVMNIGENCLNKLTIGDLIVAEHDTYCFYCRAVIKTLKSRHSFEVEFIDYGNTAVVSPSKVCRIEKKFLTLPRLSVHCSLRVKPVPDGSWTSEITSYFLSKINNKPVTCKFLKQRGEQWEIDVICDGKSMSRDLLQKKGRTKWQNAPAHHRARRSKQVLVTTGSLQDRKSSNCLGGWRKTKAVRMKNIPKTPLKVFPQDLISGQVEGAKVTSISESGELHVQLFRNLEFLHELDAVLVKEAQRSDLLTVDDIEAGLVCMTKSENNLRWYRSEVIKKFVKEKLVLVFFMDYGNCEMVSVSNVKMLSDEMKSIPKQAVLCKWVWLKKLNKLEFVHVINALLVYEIRIVFLRYLECSRMWEVDILIGEVLLLEHLNKILSHYQTAVGREKASNTDCKELDTSFRINSMTWTLLHSGRSYPGFATAVTDPSNFCVQFEVFFNCMEKLALLLSGLPDNLPALPEELVAPGTNCLVKFECEAQWNRAEISEVTSQSVVLTIIDYGFLKSIPYSDIHKLKVVPESLSYLPRLAYSCSLHEVVPSRGECWSDEAKLLFHELLNKPDLVFHFKHYGSEMKLEVDVLHKKSNLAHTLISAGHAVYSKARCCLIPVDQIKV
ncbi:PREDICTED: tudor domain-containing protein 15-like [Merops nubicus]|uniref:tudor domain-containing protein 15-like n=1 Tax=Merops nubicus TaxID=57421 RepID=UPI0004F02D11|nr:PREDICTED: tudor domain-containing protein 15-like [Merops nubicus]